MEIGQTPLLGALRLFARDRLYNKARDLATAAQSPVRRSGDGELRQLVATNCRLCDLGAIIESSVSVAERRMELGPSGKLLAVRTLVVQDERVLLVGHRSAGAERVWWMAPGGLVHQGESALDAAAREVKEETGLEVGIDRLVYWLEWIWERSHCVELYFLGKVTGGALTVGTDPELTQSKQVIFDARFFDMKELGQYPVYPKGLEGLLKEHLEQGFPPGATYLGLSEPDLPR